MCLMKLSKDYEEYMKMPYLANGAEIITIDGGVGKHVISQKNRRTTQKDLLP